MLGNSGINFASKAVNLNKKTYANKSENEPDFSEKNTLKKNTVSFGQSFEDYSPPTYERND